MTTAKFRTPRQNLLKRKPLYVDQDIVNNIVRTVSKVCNIEERLITKKGRYRPQVLARNMCFYILHVHYKQKSAQIAPYFNRDRTTVLHGVNTFVNDVEVVPYYMEQYIKVRSKIKVPKLYADNYL
jgi:chromosomal replication initiation ATPase DnaA